MSSEDLKIVVREAVKETFLLLGFDLNNPICSQDDFRFLRKTRRRCESITTKAILTAVGIMVTGVFGGAAWAIVTFIQLN